MNFCHAHLTDEDDGPRDSDLPSFFEQPYISDTSIIDQYIYLTPYLGRLIQRGLDSCESICHVKLKDTQMRRRWYFDILNYTSCCNDAITP